MFKNYFKIAFRNLFRHKVFSVINIVGLAIGMACSILIGLYVYDEYCFDRFHVNATRIYRMTQEYVGPGKQIHLPYVGPSVAPALVNEFPGIEQAVRFGITAPVMIGHNDTYIVPAGTETYYATPNVFDVFTFPLMVGNPATALMEPYSIVISESFARRFFADIDPMGQFLKFQVQGQERQDIQVTGIVQDVPAKSHLQFECLVSYSTLEDINRDNPAWDTQFVATYLMLKEDVPALQIETKLYDFIVKHGGKTQTDNQSLHLQPMNEYSKG